MSSEIGIEQFLSQRCALETVSSYPLSCRGGDMGSGEGQITLLHLR